MATMNTNIINSFPGYEYVYDKENKQYRNMYRGTDVGHGGYIISNPGIYSNVALLDVASLHPNSIRAMNCFGEYTKNFTDILDARIAIKHKDFDTARAMLDGRLAPYLEDESTAKDLAQALKIAINSVYGLTAAKFDNPFKDSRNKNNIVALRGALFMRTLQDEVEERGFQIVAIKTDSIKIANASQDIIDFCMEFAKKYGYTFEHECTYERMCQINDADYIAKDKATGKWTATGAQFAVPYVFKTLFSKEPIVFEDLCEAKSVQQGALYLDTNEGFPDVSVYEAVMALRTSNKSWDKLTKKEKALLDEYADIDDKTLDDLINNGHDYHFIGRVGNFCPIKPGCNGGTLYRYADNKYFAATGTKGYRWLESEMVKTLGKEEDIDLSYYRNLVDGAVDAISQYGDFERFVAEEPWPEQEFYFDWKGVIEDPYDDVPPWEG